MWRDGWLEEAAANTCSHTTSSCHTQLRSTDWEPRRLQQRPFFFCPRVRACESVRYPREGAYSHHHGGWGGGSEPRAGHARAGARQEICDSRRGRSFDVGVKTRRPRRGTHAETLRAGQTGTQPCQEERGRTAQSFRGGLGRICMGEFAKTSGFNVIKGSN